jgi:L-threonylcarbamoyladenylate synthase
MVIFSQKPGIIGDMSLSQFLSLCTADTLARAAEDLKGGTLVAFPTETVYGLGADATNAAAVARIYSVKGRPADHPLIVHLAEMQDVNDWASDIPDYAIDLARAFWPGPMTLILPRTELAKDFITGGQSTVGLRVPDHRLALALLQEFKKIGGKGLAAPSANRFGQVSPTTASAVQEELGDFLGANDVILDGGPSSVGLESTIIDCTASAPRILRPGAITIEMIEKVSGLKIEDRDEEIRVSGSLENHYAPSAQILLDGHPRPGDGYIAIKSYPTPEGAIRLAAPVDNEDFARQLYGALREADAQEIDLVVVLQPEGDDIAVAIRDRLMRASQVR